MCNPLTPCPLPCPRAPCCCGRLLTLAPCACASLLPSPLCFSLLVGFLAPGAACSFLCTMCLGCQGFPLAAVMIADIFRPFIGFKEVRLVHKEVRRVSPFGLGLCACLQQVTDSGNGSNRASK